jgi:hypothetical protein
MKGDINPDHIPVNKYQLLILGLPVLTCTKVGGLEDELATTELPDKTKASGGQHNPGEFDIEIPEHHTLEQAAMELWFIESSDPVAPTYKKVGTLISTSISGNIAVSKSLIGLFPTKRATADREMENEGEMAVVVWTLSFDQIMPL